MGFYLYKGLKKPLILLGLKNNNIYYALISIGGGFLLMIILSKFLGIIGNILGLGLGIGGAFIIRKRQEKFGLYKKTKNNDELFIFPNRIKINKKK